MNLPAPRRAFWRPWAEAHLAGLLSSLGRMLRRPLGSGLTLAVLALAIALPVCLAALLKEAGQFAGTLRDSRDISVFLRPGLDQAAAEQFALQWRADARIAQLDLRSPAEGLAELGEMRELGDALQALEHNPLPWMALIVPQHGSDDHALAAALRAAEGVDLVQHDALWRERLAAWLALGQQLALLAALLLGSAVLLVIANSVRLEVQARAEEIAVLRLLGASDAFIRRPFLYLGAWYGFVSALLALLLVHLAALWLAPKVAELIASYGSRFTMTGGRLLEWAVVIASAALLGWLGAFLAVGYQLQQAESQP